MRNANEIAHMADGADELVAEEMAKGAKHYPGQSYMEGVQAALNWALGRTDEDPIDSEETEA